MTERSIKTPRETSPYSLIQEKLRDKPWQLLVACIMLNQTSATQARPIWDEFFKKWPDPRSFLDFFEDWDNTRQELVSLIRPLGFQNRRADRIFRMSQEYSDNLSILEEDPSNVKLLYGVGKYASDSYKIFVGGFLVLDVEDKELQNYVRWALSLEEERTD